MIASLVLLAQITMNLSAPQQTIDGFGAAGSIFGANGTPNEGSWSNFALDTLYNPFGSVALTIWRGGIANANSQTNSLWLDNNPGFQNIMVDCKRVLLRAPSTKIILAPWSPNAACKSGGSVLTGSFLSSCNTSWSTYLSGVVDEAINTGCVPYAVSMQNEPDFDSGGAQESCTWTSPQLVTFLKTLGPLLAAKTPSVRMMAPDVSQWSNLYTSSGGLAYLDNCTADSSCLAAVQIWATHQYPLAVAVAVPTTLSSRPLWQTEVSGQGGADDSIADGITWALKIHAALDTGGASAWVWWWGVTQHASQNDGLIDSDGVTIPKRTYVLGQFSKFVRPGMVKFGITGTPPANVSVTTYKDPVSNNIAIVAINNQASTSSLTVILDSTSKCKVVVPWLTDSSNNVAVQTPISLGAGKTFSFTLPLTSVTTFTCSGT